MKAFEKIAVLAAIITALWVRLAKAGCGPGTYGTDGKCKICPPNYFCPGNTTEPFQCPPGFMAYDGETECIEMSEEELEYRLSRKLFTCSSMTGYYCSGASSVECSLGKYCTSGTQYDCPIGRRCPRVGTTENCPSGYYSNSGDSYCHICPAGSYCSGTPPNNPSACSGGYYALEGTTTGCTITPAGYQHVSSSQYPKRCAPGYYKTGTGSGSCSACSAGRYCSSITSSGSTWASGTYSEAGWTACKPCPAGYSCSSGVKGSACGNGYYSKEGDDGCTYCPAGSYCPTKEAPFDCMEGHYSTGGATACTECQVGYYCTGGTRYICRHGYYADQTGMSACRRVPTHFYANSISGASSVTRCGIDQYTDGMMLGCYTCDDAHQCFKNDDVKPCPYGFYKKAGEWFCRPCGAGYHWSISSSGVGSEETIATYEASLSTTEKNYPRFSGIAEMEPKVCPPNNYCSDDGLIYHICPHGTYPYITGCATCPADKFCMTSFNRQATITTGSESSAGDSFPRFQPQGYTWDGASWINKHDFRSTKSHLGKVTNSQNVLTYNCPQGYSCTHSIHARCPSSHQGKYITSENVGMVGEDQNIIHNYETLSGLTYTKFAYSKLNTTYSQCLPCNGGYSCSLGNDPVACAGGKYSPTGEAECFTCPPGYYCPSKSETPTPCPVNKKNSNAGQNAAGDCTSCQTGYWAPEGSSICEPCPAGYACSTGALVLCSIGTYSTEGESTCSACQEGYLCDRGATIRTPPENLCPKGSYCKTVSGATLQYKCPKGTYGIGEGATDSSDCITCPPGFVCREGTDDFTKYPCPQGNYCPAGTSSPTQCAAGTYNPNTGGMSIASCRTCPAGYYCPIESTTYIICPVGHYCPSGTTSKTQFPCPAGTYSGTRTGARLQSDCFPCTIGHYWAQGSTTPTPAPEGYYIPYMGATDSKAALPCPPGYPCTGTGNYDYKGFACSKGHYCPLGSTSSTANKCPAGTYTDREDLFSADQCTVCPSGYYCLTGAAYSNLVICPQGYYCPPGTNSATQHPCPTGTYGDTTGLKSDQECKNCTAGGGCGSGASASITCAQGYYCPAGTTTSTPADHKAPAGSYIDYTGAISQYDNKPCGLGFYCPEGAIGPTQCAIGTYSAILRASTCTTCPAGYYCDVVQMSAPKACAAGFYSSSGASACTRCPEGYYWHQQATTKTTMLTQVCPAGLICSQTISSVNYGLALSPNLKDHACPAGKYCTGGYATADCPAGTYNPIKGRTSSSDWLQTPAGFYTLAGASEYLTTKCQEGYYCLAGSTTATQNPCPKGTFRGVKGGRKPEDCGMCKTGYVCNAEATVTPTNCGAGNYCPLGTIIPELCPVGTYSSALNLPDSRSCTKWPTGYYCGSKGMTVAVADANKCDAGFYCIEGAIRPDPTDGITGKICPAGGYCLRGATSVSSCPSGKYNPEEGAKVADSCIVCLPGKYCFGSANPAPTGECTAGYYCPAGSSSPTQNSVPVGHYAPAGSDFAIPCPRGTYQPSTQKEACIDCEEGSYWPDEQMTASQTCPVGYYCPSNTHFKTSNLYYEPQRCPVGTYNDIPSKTQLSDCKACPAGKYCAAEALSAVSGTCAAGYYCKTNSPFEKPAIDDGSSNYGRCPTGHHCAAGTSVPTACVAGKYSAFTKSVDDTNCKDCEPGHYCATAGLSAPTGQCTPGYYCAKGSTSATAAECTATNYCPQGSANEEKCPIGYYNTLTKQGKCTECEAGYTCFNGEKANCPKGYYCP